MEGIAKSEGRLVAELAEASKRADEKLRNEVAELAEDHMARRGAILEGLQALAVRLGAFPQQLEQLTGGKGTAKAAVAPNDSIEPERPRLRRPARMRF